MKCSSKSSNNSNGTHSDNKYRFNASYFSFPNFFDKFSQFFKKRYPESAESRERELRHGDPCYSLGSAFLDIYIKKITPRMAAKNGPSKAIPTPYNPVVKLSNEATSAIILLKKAPITSGFI